MEPSAKKSSLNILLELKEKSSKECDVTLASEDAAQLADWIEQLKAERDRLRVEIVEEWAPSFDHSLNVREAALNVGKVDHTRSADEIIKSLGYQRDEAQIDLQRLISLGMALEPLGDNEPEMVFKIVGNLIFKMRESISLNLPELANMANIPDHAILSIEKGSESSVQQILVLISYLAQYCSFENGEELNLVDLSKMLRCIYILNSLK